MPSRPQSPNVVIYRSELLPRSETFIARQASALRRFEPRFVGLKHIPGGLIQKREAVLLSQTEGFLDRAGRALYRLAGIAPAFLQQVAALRPALVHAHFAVDAAEALPLVRALDVPLVVTLHGYDVMMSDAAHATSSRGRAYLRARPYLAERTGLFLCVSAAIRRRALERGFAADKLVVHAIGIDPQLFVPIAQRDRHTVLFVGRLVEKKGCIHLLRAMALLRLEDERACLVVIGDGPLRSALEAEASRLGVSAIFLGAQTGAEVQSWMRSARVLAVPSITAANGDAEGLPTVLCEALAAGLPVACFSSSGIGELVRDGETGLLVPEGDERGLAVNIQKLCRDDRLCEHFSSNGRLAIEEHFNLGRQTAELERHYQRVIEAFRCEAAEVPGRGMDFENSSPRFPHGAR